MRKRLRRASQQGSAAGVPSMGVQSCGKLRGSQAEQRNKLGECNRVLRGDCQSEVLRINLPDSMEGSSAGLSVSD